MRIAVINNLHVGGLHGYRTFSHFKSAVFVGYSVVFNSVITLADYIYFYSVFYRSHVGYLGYGFYHYAVTVNKTRIIVVHTREYAYTGSAVRFAVVHKAHILGIHGYGARHDCKSAVFVGYFVVVGDVYRAPRF